ncbi:MAG TPA: competence/damage-inducible protein A [Rubricoccaceae bacterium]|nr:competence/damage-inducible protein A [Rubricoccaceae bacterium]
MTAVLLTVGDELLIGQVVNTNAAWLGDRLGQVGVDVRRAEVVGDDEAVIGRALTRALGEGVDVVIMTGGLGPTHDDLTKKAIAQAFGVPLRFESAVFEGVRARLAARGRIASERHRLFGEVPEGFEALENPKGLAPGLWGERDGKAVVLLPGVPFEMEAVVEAHVLPRLQERAAGFAVLHRTLQTTGEGETALSARLGDLSTLLRGGLALAFLPTTGGVRLRLSIRGEDRAAAQATLDHAAERIRAILGDLVFGEGEATLEEAVGERLLTGGLTLAVAESCTGGALAARITRVPGASRYFRGGVVAYDNDVKAGLLGVDRETLDREGAVSEAVARQLAEGARRHLGADLAVATTGIAGPGGGTAEKPVGLVWFGYADARGTHAVRARFTTDREVNIALAATTALDLVRRQLQAGG